MTGVLVHPDELRMPGVRPVTAYGYMRVPRDVPDEKVMDLENRMRALAAGHDLDLVTFFYEFDCGSREAFTDLLHQLDNASTRNVVIPTLRHLAHSSRLQEFMLQALLFPSGATGDEDGDGGVLVLEFEDLTWRTSRTGLAGGGTGGDPRRTARVVIPAQAERIGLAR